MSLHIYQIGNSVFNIKGSTIAGLEISMPRSWQGSVRRYGMMPLTTMTIPYPVAEPVEVSISGTIMPQGDTPIMEQLNRLLALGGHQFVDVIAYFPNECCTAGSACSVCDGMARRCVTWLTTTAFISSISPSLTLDDSGISPSDGMAVDIQMTLRDYWQGLNPWLWEPYYNASPVSGLRRLDDPYMSDLPCKPPGHGAWSPGALIFNKKNYRYPFDLYDVEVWRTIPNAVGRDWGAWPAYTVGDNPMRWSAPPSSNWQFRNMPASGQINITIESDMGGYSLLSHESYINLASLDSELDRLGYDGIQSSDILIATDSIYAPSVFVRNNEILPVSPLWTFRYAYIGQCLGAVNDVILTVPGDTSSAHLHIFRSN